MQSLLFFNKEGDNLNFIWDGVEEKWKGDLIFHENSNDTFKTQALYVFEMIPSFEYELPGSLRLDRFQLFNESKITLYGNEFFTQSVTKIEASNNNPEFFSKWIMGEDFEKKFPVGSKIFFNNPKFEFTNSEKTYSVVQTKKGAILIISSQDNKTFNETWANTIGLTSSYQDLTISGFNGIGIYDYVNSDLTNKLSNWNENEFYQKKFIGKKLNLINFEKNNGLVTIGENKIDDIFWRYELDRDFLNNQDLRIDLVLKTDLPKVYEGYVKISENRIYFLDQAPNILKPGQEFTIPQSIQNQVTFLVSQIDNFDANTTRKTYITGSLVIWEKNIYECIQSYDWGATSSINPSNINYWVPNTYVPIQTSVIEEEINNAQVQLTTNIFSWTFSFTQSSEVFLGGIQKTLESDFSQFNIDLKWDGFILSADLKYPTKWAEIHFKTIDGNIGQERTTYENNITSEEVLVPEIDKNFSENFSYNIVITDLDEYGLKITINNEEYHEDTDFIFVGTSINFERTIDRTLRNWLMKNYGRLFTLGIIPKLGYIGLEDSIFYNSLELSTTYPNVPLVFSVKVGTTADFYIQHTEVIFYDMSNYLNIVINGRSYGQSVTINSGVPDISEALSEWVIEYSDDLNERGIFIENINQILVFKTKKQDTRLELDVRVGKSSLPGQEFYSIIKKYSGNFGSLITSNSITLPSEGTFSFENLPFATGQIITINNSNYPYNNSEFNILSLDPKDLILSYQGPYWGTSPGFCNVSPFISVAFNGGFGATGCLPPISPTSSPLLGEYDITQFGSSFNLYNPSLNEYSLNTISVLQNTNLVDIIYLELTGSFYVLGTKLSIIDAFSLRNIKTLTLSTASFTPLSLKFNQINNYIYCLSSTSVFVVDPTNRSLKSTIILNTTPNSLEINKSNGDVYISNNSGIQIWSSSNLTNTPNTTLAIGQNFDMVWNERELDMYSVGTASLFRINGSNRTIQTQYTFNGELFPKVFYEPINYSVYVFDSQNLRNVKSGNITTISGVGTSSFNEIIFDHLKGDIKISQDGDISRVSLDGQLTSNVNVSSYGNMVINPQDGFLYLGGINTSRVLVLDMDNNLVISSLNLPTSVKKLIFNPKRMTVFALNDPNISEIKVNIFTIPPPDVVVNPDVVTEDVYGSLSPGNIVRTDIWIKTRDYIRKPRENFNNEPSVKYIWKWETDEYPQMFLFDFSGDQLPTTGDYSYTGEKPLKNISLNRNPNKDQTKRNLPEYQQTIFNEIITTLEKVDSENDLTILPEPLELFIGFRSDDEGWLKSPLILSKRWDINFTLNPTLTNNNFIEFKFVSDVSKPYGIINLDINSFATFTLDDDNIPRGLVPGQIILIELRDITNKRNKYLPLNNGKRFKIREVYSRQLIVDFIDSSISNEKTNISGYPSTGISTFLSFKLSVLDKEIGRFNIWGQTEIEDIRYDIELSNIGQNVTSEDIYIFKTYDINEQGVDWKFLNAKRKEMMSVRHDIFPYIGSYKSIINVINYFGYNDLELYEYYRNINQTSPDFGKLFKVEIPDIFDNSSPGFTVNDFIKNTMPNPNYDVTNLFNLTYKITDKEGNNVLMYSLPEVIIKLEGLKYWLQKKIIPITHRILDITGRADFVGQSTIVHRNYDIKIINIKESFSPVDFKLTEAYLQPVNSGSSVYTCNIDFSCQDLSNSPFFTLKIRTYKTYREWDAFTIYNIGDKVYYFGEIYESAISSNKMRNPRKYSGAPTWNSQTDYTIGQFVNYRENIYQWVGTQSSFTTYGTNSNIITPQSDIIQNGAFSKWSNNTEWKIIDWEPVQTQIETRTSLQSYLFTLDSNIDPFVTIEVTSDNGYGQSYTSKKNYEIRGTNDLFINYNGDKIGPFKPILQITGRVI